MQRRFKPAESNAFVSCPGRAARYVALHSAFIWPGGGVRDNHGGKAMVANWGAGAE